MYIEAGELPLEQRRIKLSLQYILKLKSTSSNPAYRCVFHPEYEQKYTKKNQKTISPIGIRMKNHLEGCDILLNQVSVDEVYDIPQWEVTTPTVNLSLHSSSKSDTLNSEYKQRFLELNDSYEEKRFTAVYTDGSKSGNYVSASVVSSADILKVNLPVHTSIFTAEAVALKVAVQFIQRQVIPRAVIYSDSLSCLHTPQNKNLDHPIIREILHVLTYLQDVGTQIEFCWIPGHVGIHGNEKADQVAKEVIDQQMYGIKIPYSDFKSNICQYVNTLFQTFWTSCTSNKLHGIKDQFSPLLPIYSSNRKEDIILTRLRIGHSRLTHKHFLLNEDFPECIPCNCLLTVKHILVEYVDIADIRKQYFNCNDLKTLFNSVAGDTILAFLQEIHLIDKI